MALTLQRTLELGGALSKVQPQLQRLHIVKKPKKRHLLRNVALVGSTLAVGAVVAVVVLRGRSCRTKAVAGDGQGTQARGQETPEAEPDWEGLPIDVDAPHDIAIPVPA
jgi:hypothetical protein